MDLIDRYVHEVGRSLPRRQRADVQAELNSLLREKLEEEAHRQGRTVDEPLAAEVLREFGSPEEIADRYRPEQYLIGPRLYPAFRATATGIVVVLAALYAAGAVLGWVFTSRPFTWSAVVALVDGYARVALINVALATLVFAALDRVLGRHAPTPSSPAAEWDPRTLPEVHDPDEVSRGSRAWSVYLTFALLALFNFAPGWIGIIFGYHEGAWRILPLLRPEFTIHLPLLNAWWTSALVLHLLVLRRGRWSRGTRLAQLLLGVSGAVILWTIIAGPPVFAGDRLVKLVLKLSFVASIAENAWRAYRLAVPTAIAPWRTAAV
jgi:HAAS domain-containing protein